MTEIPSELDWVKKRAECNMRAMFERLRAQVVSDVGTRNKQLPADADTRRDVLGEPGSTYITVGYAGFPTSNLVTFHFHGQELRISGERTAERVVFLTLTEEGTCKFKFVDDEIHPWQLSRRVLEPVLFG